MKMKKIVSAFSALAMTVTAMAGLAVTANAATVNAELLNTASYNVGYTTYGDPAGATYNQERQVFHMYDSEDQWTAVAYAEFDLSEIPDGETITSATLKYYAVNNNRTNRTVKLTYVRDLAGVDLTNLTKRISNISGIIHTSGNIAKNNPTEVTVDVKATIENMTDDRVIFAFGDMNDGGYLYGKGSTEYAPTLVIETSAAEPVPVSFTETNGVGATVVVNGNDVTNGTELVPGEYTYTATATGYKPVSGTFTINDGDSDVAVTFTLEAIPSAPSKTLPEDAESLTTVTTSMANDVNTEFSGYDTLGDGYTWYTTMDFYLTDDSYVTYLGKTNRSSFSSAGQSTSVKLGTDEVRYYTSSSGTPVAGGLEANKWYTLTITSDLKATLATADSGNTMDYVITEAGTNNVVAKATGVGMRNAGQGMRYVSASGTQGSVVANFYSYFIKDAEPEDTPATEVTVEGYENTTKAFKVTDFALDNAAPTWTITAKPAEGDAQIQTIEAEIANVEAGNVSLGLIIDNVPENVTVSATLGY